MTPSTKHHGSGLQAIQQTVELSKPQRTSKPVTAGDIKIGAVALGLFLHLFVMMNGETLRFLRVNSPKKVYGSFGFRLVLECLGNRDLFQSHFTGPIDKFIPVSPVPKTLRHSHVAWHPLSQSNIDMDDGQFSAMIQSYGLPFTFHRDVTQLIRRYSILIPINHDSFFFLGRNDPVI